MYTAALEMHPLDVADRIPHVKQGQGIGYCNITKCCTKVCPENITITDNAIIPLKERVVDEFYDPLGRLVKLFSPGVDSARVGPPTGADPMYSLKPIARAAIPAALEKAEHYRLLNDSAAAESICLDVLEVEPDHQLRPDHALLAITDQIVDELSAGVTRARAVLPRLHDEYHRHYYAGIICERRGKAQFRQRTPRVPRRSPAGGCARPCTITALPRRSVQRRTTRRSCNGTRVRAR